MWTVQLITQPGMSYLGWWSSVHEHLFPVWTGSPKVTMDHACKGGAWLSQDSQNFRLQRDRQTEDGKSAGHCGGRQQRAPFKATQQNLNIFYCCIWWSLTFHNRRRVSIHLQYIETPQRICKIMTTSFKAKSLHHVCTHVKTTAQCLQDTKIQH